MNSLNNISRTHSEKVRARYARGERYSVEATKLQRKKNHQRWLEKTKLKHGQRFDYSSTAQDYETQKNPPVRVKCLRHDKTFNVLSDKHMQNQHGGCSACSEEASRSTRLGSEREKFENWFNDNRSDRLTIVSEFQGMTTELIVFCKIHNSEKRSYPQALCIKTAMAAIHAPLKLQAPPLGSIYQMQKQR